MAATKKTTRRKIHLFKASAKEWAVIRAKAKLYTGGNVSEWIRRAAINALSL